MSLKFLNDILNWLNGNCLSDCVITTTKLLHESGSRFSTIAINKESDTFSPAFFNPVAGRSAQIT